MIKTGMLSLACLMVQLSFSGADIFSNTQPADINLMFGNTFEEILKNWNLKTLVGKDEYEVIRKQTGNILRIASRQSASVLFKKIDFDAYEYPNFRWQWVVDKFPKYSDPRKDIDIDDYAARVCVAFPSWNILATKFLIYVWDDRVDSKNVIKPSAMSKNCKIIVVECGKKNKGRWVTVERNIIEDYKMAFGGQAPKKAAGVGLMSDSDDTKTSTDARYYNIHLRSAI